MSQRRPRAYTRGHARSNIYRHKKSDTEGNERELGTFCDTVFRISHRRLSNRVLRVFELSTETDMAMKKIWRIAMNYWCYLVTVTDEDHLTTTNSNNDKNKDDQYIFVESRQCTDAAL